ncbi:hypothetical protein [Mesorhizobium sp. 2RAF21]|uniref:hypothetical protein n=1 Tax=Mesorhizobium sp. 2RAF21 TaxID=3232995 RepID=UPI003F98B2AE
MKVRDTQRARLYRAERALETLASSLPTVSDVERYLQQQSSRQTLRSRYGNAVDVTDWKLMVTDGRGCRSALAYGDYKIAIPLWARKDWVVLHEWAHIVHERTNVCSYRYSWAPMSQHGSRTLELRGGAAHGWQYAAIYLDLVHFCMGKEAADALKASFKIHNVRFRPKRTTTTTPEQIERLAAMRLAARPR